MINNNISYYLTLTFWVRPLRGELHSFCGTWLRCNSLEWGASERRTRDPAKRGSGSAGDAATAFQGARIPLQGHTFLRKALLLPSRSHHSASLRLALHPKNRTLHPVQLPDSGLKKAANAALFRRICFFTFYHRIASNCSWSGLSPSAAI